MYHSSSETCSSLDVTFGVVPIYSKYLHVHSKPRLHNICVTLKTLALYACTTCLLAVMHVHVVLSCTNLAVPKCILRKVVIMNKILVLPKYLLSISDFQVFLSLVDLPFCNPKLGL